MRAGLTQLERAVRLRRPGEYQLQAAITAVHIQAPDAESTDWAQIASLYGALAQLSPSPVVELNRAVAVGFAEGPPPASRCSSRCSATPRSSATSRCTPRTPSCWRARRHPRRRARVRAGHRAHRPTPSNGRSSSGGGTHFADRCPKRGSGCDVWFEAADPGGDIDQEKRDDRFRHDDAPAGVRR